MTYIFAVACITVMLACVFLLFLGLPGTWGILALAGVWAFFDSSSVFTMQFFLLWGGLCLVAEVVEFLAGYYGAKLYGGTDKGSLGGMVGALAGGIVCAPLFFGIGALLGALAGGFLGCFVVEKGRGMASGPAAKAAFGVTLGRFGGFVVKLALAVSLLFHAVPGIWQSV